MVESDEVYCFLDANILIHFQMFDEVDWSKLLNKKTVNLVLAPSVLRNLDKFKDDRKDWRNKRVRSIISKLKLFQKDVNPGEKAKIREGVNIIDLYIDPNMTKRSEIGLRPEIDDDWLLATILEYSEKNPTCKLIFVTNDYNVGRKA